MLGEKCKEKCLEFFCLLVCFLENLCYSLITRRKSFGLFSGSKPAKWHKVPHTQTFQVTQEVAGSSKTSEHTNYLYKDLFCPSAVCPSFPSGNLAFQVKSESVSVDQAKLYASKSA